MAVKNLVSGVLAQSITTSTTNILVNIAENVDASAIQSFFPTPPFYITIMPKNPAVGVANRLDSEILQVTAVGSDQSGNATLTCVRGQRDTTAKAFGVGSIVTVGVYADDAVFLGGEGSAVGTPTPWIEPSDIIWPDLLDKIYPVGSIYMSATLSTPSSVANALGGTWVAWGAGRVPVGVDPNDTSFDTAEEKGGEKTHILTVSEIPSHTHGAYYTGSSAQDKIYSWYGATGNAMAYDLIPSGGDGAHNNLQPYITCYMYKRTA